MSDTYGGPVCYRDGWHWTVDADGDPDERLYLDEEDGTYRVAVDGDESWHDRHHQRFAAVEMS